MHPIELTSPVRLKSGTTATTMGRAFVGIEYRYDVRLENGTYLNNIPASEIQAVIGEPRSDILR